MKYCPFCYNLDIMYGLSIKLVETDKPLYQLVCCEKCFARMRTVWEELQEDCSCGHPNELHEASEVLWRVGPCTACLCPSWEKRRLWSENE